MPARGKYRDWITDEALTKIEGWAHDGLTEKQIAEEKIGINETTLQTWKNRFPQIKQALKQGKVVVDRNVENAMLKAALGYEYEETETFMTVNDDGSKSKKVKKIKKYAQPNTTAQIFWLKNRKPAEWRDRHNIEANVQQEQKNPFKDLTKEQLIKLAESGDEDES